MVSSRQTLSEYFTQSPISSRFSSSSSSGRHRDSNFLAAQIPVSKPKTCTWEFPGNFSSYPGWPNPRVPTFRPKSKTTLLGLKPAMALTSLRLLPLRSGQSPTLLLLFLLDLNTFLVWAIYPYWCRLPRKCYPSLPFSPSDRNWLHCTHLSQTLSVTHSRDTPHLVFDPTSHQDAVS